MESHRHQSAASLAPLVIARERIIRTAEAQARVEDVDAGAWVEQGTSDVEMGHRLIFVVFLDRDECFWHLNWKIKGKQNKMSAYTSTKSAFTRKLTPFSSLCQQQGCPRKRKPFSWVFSPLNHVWRD